MLVGDETKIKNANIDVMTRMKCYSFDQYEIKSFNLCCVTLPIDKLKWNQDVCNFLVCFKKFMFKHIVSIAIRLNVCKAPLAVRDVLTGSKRYRRRPSKAKTHY